MQVHYFEHIVKAHFYFYHHFGLLPPLAPDFSVTFFTVDNILVPLDLVFVFGSFILGSQLVPWMWFLALCIFI